VWEHILDITIGRLAFWWFRRAVKKHKTYGDWWVIPPGYEFYGWVEKHANTNGTLDPLDSFTTIGFKVYPTDLIIKHQVKVRGK